MNKLALLLCLFAFLPNPGWACRESGNDFIVAQCSKEKCSKAFAVENEIYKQCHRIANIRTADPVALKAFRLASTMLTEKEEPIVFVHATYCDNGGYPSGYINTSSLAYYDEEQRNSISRWRIKFGVAKYVTQKNHSCESEFETIRLNQGEEITYLRSSFAGPELKEKNYEQALEYFNDEAWQTKIDFIMYYVFLCGIFPVLIFAMVFGFRKTLFSSLFWPYKIILAIPLVLCHLVIMILAYDPSSHPVPELKLPAIFAGSLYFFYFVRWRIRKKRAKTM